MPSFFKKPIFTGFSPNAERDDVLLAAKLLLQPWKWNNGEARAQLEEAMKKLLGVRHAFAFESGRTSLMISLLTLDLKEEDEVLLQAFTCVAVPNAVRWASGKPVYVDCTHRGTMDPDDFTRKVTTRTRAVIIQHTFGDPGITPLLITIARKHGLVVIEDCAHTIDPSPSGKTLGAFGDMAIFSFGRDKAISSVFGGMLVTNDAGRAKQIQSLHESAPLPKKSWIAKQLLHPLICAASSATFAFGVGKPLLFLAKKTGMLSLAVSPKERKGKKPAFIGKKMPNALSLLALHQLSKLDRYNAHRLKISFVYLSLLSEKSDFCWAPLWTPLRFSWQSADPDKLFRFAKRRSIYLGDWYRTPIAPGGVSYARIGYELGSCPNAELLAREMINLPLDIHITESDAKRIVDCIKDFHRQGNSGEK